MASNRMMGVQPVGAVRPHAALGKRFIAFVIDSAAAALLGGALLIPALVVLTRSATDFQSPPLWAVIFVIAGNLLTLALAIFQWWYQGTRGFTIGKLLVKIRTVDATSGTPAGMLRILLRQFILGVGSGLVALSTLFDRQGRNRGWHDLAAETVVIDYAAVSVAPESPRRPLHRLAAVPRQPGQQRSAQTSHPGYPTPDSPLAAPTLPPGLPAPTPHSAPHPQVPPQQNPPPPAPTGGRVPALPPYLVNQNNAPAQPQGFPRPAPAPPAPVAAPPTAQPAQPPPAAHPPEAAVHRPPSQEPPHSTEQSVPRPAAPAPAPAPASEPLAESEPVHRPQPVEPQPAKTSAAALSGPQQQDTVIMAVPGYSTAQRTSDAAANADEDAPEASWARRSKAAPDAGISGIPPSATLNFSDGKRITLTETVLIGRNPRPGSSEVIGELIRVSDPGRSVSKTHVLIGVDDEGVWVVDRASTNGTIVTLADAQQIICTANQVVRLPDGAVVSFGDYSIHFEYRNN